MTSRPVCLTPSTLIVAPTIFLNVFPKHELVSLRQQVTGRETPMADYYRSLLMVNVMVFAYCHCHLLPI